MGRMNFDFLSSGKQSAEQSTGVRHRADGAPVRAHAAGLSERPSGRGPSAERREPMSAHAVRRAGDDRNVEASEEVSGVDWQQVVADLRVKLEDSAKSAASGLSVVGERIPVLTRAVYASVQAGISQVRQAQADRRASSQKDVASERAPKGAARGKRSGQGARRRLGVSRWQGLAVLSSLALAVGLTGLRAASKDEAPAVIPALPPTFTEAAQAYVAPPTAKRAIPGMTSRSYVVVDAATKEILVSKDGDQARSIASLTKLMSSMVYLDLAPDLNEVIEITAEDRKGARPAHTRLQKGWKLTSNDLLHAALIASENPAVAALARSTGLTRAEFVGMMNRKAQELGMTSSIFFDVSGLDSGNMASAADVARMVDAAGKYPLIHEIATMSGYEATVLNSGRKLAYVNSNRLARYGSFEVVAGKTGYISDAGYCLTLSIRQGGRELLMAFLNSHSKAARFADATRAAAWVAENAPTAVASNP